ncbi:MAG: hypothetical protein NVV59_16485 [Chitinophagaceae bacterium]|nr:hypothetical protein [Chitinophagaceae bacterium]
MKMTKTSATILALLATVLLNAQAPTDRDKVKELCGCFDVNFQFAETFSPQQGYKYHDRENISGGTELVYVVEETDKKLVMQHLLIITDSIIIKHWREEWSYENPERWIYEGNNVWKKTYLKPEEVKGKWTQTVWEVSDAPRYQGHSQWVSLDGKWIWQNTADAPLPRREYTSRNDYNILRRTNRIMLTDKGYVHDQDNEKIKRENGKDELLVAEKGWNTYNRVEEKECKAGLAYWEKTKEYWTAVRLAWEEYLKTHDRIQLKQNINGKVLHDHLFVQAAQYTKGQLKKDDIAKTVTALLSEYLGG